MELRQSFQIASGRSQRRRAKAAATFLVEQLPDEIGHLLLGTTTHAKEGLMREQWLTSQVKRGFGRDWSFTQGDVAEIRQGLAPAPADERAKRLAWVGPLPMTP